MTDQKIDGGKRTWIIASSCAGAIGAGFVAVPFVSSFAPSERAKAAGAKGWMLKPFKAELLVLTLQKLTEQLPGNVSGM